MSKALETARACIAQPWRRAPGRPAQIECYSTKGMAWVIVAETRKTPEFSAEDVAEMIVGAVNGKNANDDVFEELVSALELCLECDGLTWEAEQAGDIALRKAGEITGGVG